MTPREELEALRRLAELEKKAAGPAEDPGFLGTAAISTGNWLDSKAAGLREAVGTYVPSGKSIVGAIDKLDTMRGVAPPTVQARQEVAPAMESLEQQRPGAMLAGSFIPEMAAKTPLGMALLGGLDPGTLGERATRAGMGYAGGKVGEGLGWAAGKVMGRGSADAAPKLADDFFPGKGGNKWGIPLTTGQATQYKPAQIAESVVSNLPGGAGVMNKANDRTFGAFNRAVARTFGDDATSLTPEVMGAARERVGAKIGDIAKRNTLTLDQQFAQEIAQRSQEAASELTDDSLRLFNKQLDNLLSQVKDGTVSGKFYQSLDTKLGRMAKGTNDGNLKNQLAGFRKSMRDAFDRSVSEADSEAWQLTRKQYANLMTVADAAKNTGDGALSPARLLQAVNAAQPNAKFGSGTDLAELAQWAKKTLPDKIPNSGTAQRLFYQKLLTSPLTTVGAVGGGAYGADSLGLGPGSAAAGVALPYLLARGLAGKPVSKATEEWLKRIGGGLLGASALEYSR